jgi:hypothetical protein
MTARKESPPTSDNRSQKIAATKAAKARQFKTQTVRIDDHWRIIRADSLNWEIQYKGKFYGYFADLHNAFKALPGKMLRESAKDTLADVLECQRGVVALIERALPAI